MSTSLDCLRIVTTHTTKIITTKNIILEVSPTIKDIIKARKKVKIGMCLQ